MSLPRKTNEELLTEIREAFAGGFTAAAAERAVGLARRRADDTAFLVNIVELLAEACVNSPRRRAGRPKKSAITATTHVLADGRMETVMDLSAQTPQTKIEARREVANLVKDFEIYEKVSELTKKLTVTGAFVEAARILKRTEAEVRQAYYRNKR